MMQVESLQLLTVWEAYRIADGKVVVGESDKQRFYNPLGSPELPGRLADVEDGDEDSALAFVQRWGLLGFSELYTSQATAQQRAKFEADFGEWGDPLGWIWAHARNARILVKLISLLKGGDPEPITGYLDRLMAETPPPLQGSMLTYASGTSTSRAMGFGQAIDGPLQAAASIVRNIINENVVKHVSPQLVIYNKETGGMARSHTASALLPVIYTHLMEAAIGAKGYYQCAYRNCQRWWPVNHERRGPRSQYCPPEVGGESLCSRKERYHKIGSTKKKGSTKA